ncbi:MAG: type VI secretion system tube protein Hcp [Pirellulales bacterium]|nr:type VI secretion system tube protein Hcp [Pirellulales bacterium]
MMFKRCLFFWCALLGCTALARAGLFLQVDGIQGGSTAEGYENAIEIKEFALKVQLDPETGGGGGQGGSPDWVLAPQFRSIISQASPKLLLASLSGKNIREATLSVTRNNEENQRYLEWKFEDLQISSYATRGWAIGVPQEVFSFLPSAIELSYWPQKADGSLGDPIKIRYDFENNKAGGAIAVPEPSGIALLSVGVLGVALIVARRHRRVAAEL